MSRATADAATADPWIDSVELAIARASTPPSASALVPRMHEIRSAASTYERAAQLAARASTSSSRRVVGIKVPKTRNPMASLG